MRHGALGGIGVALALALAAPAAAQTPAFTFTQLPKWGGGEPSIATDPTGTGDVYVVAPQFIPAGLNQPPFEPDPSDPQNGSQGVALWISRDGGVTWPINKLTGSSTGGGDSDAEVSLAHTLYIADLEAVDTDICISHDRGNTFDNCQSGLTQDHQGPEDDREWLSRGPKAGLVYLTYHDFSAGVPIIEESTDDGQSFQPCGNILDPGGPAASTYNPANGTLVSKPVVTSDGSIYVQFSTTDPGGSNTDYNHLYMAVSKGGCSGNFKNYPIYPTSGSDPKANFANIFQWQTIDGAGNLYVIAAGHTGSNSSTNNVYVFTSRDQGQHWTAPIQVNQPNTKSNVLPTGVGGEVGDSLSVGYFGSEVSGDPNDTHNVWRYYIATTFSGGQSWTYTTATPDPIHYGDICTAGVQCTGNRNLADFSSATLDPNTGCPMYAIPGDPQNNSPSNPSHDSGNSWAYAGRQTGGPCLTATGQPTRTALAGGSSAGSSASSTTCGGRSGPRSSISKRLAKLSRRRIRLSGRAIDLVCTGPTSTAAYRAKLSKVRVFLFEKKGRKCRFLGRKGRLGRARSCSKPVFLSAKTRYIKGSSKTLWKLSKKVHLSRGTYTAGVRSTDRFGHVETRKRSYNTTRLRVR
jgi:hypothetical protein